MSLDITVTGPLAVPAAATSHALARAAERGEFAPATLADLAAAAATLGREAWRAGLEFDDLLAVVGDLVHAARLHAAHARSAAPDDTPETDALLLYLWRVTGHAYQAAVVARATPTRALPTRHSAVVA